MLNNLTNIFAKTGGSIGVEINPQKVNISQIAKQGQQYKLLKNVSADIPEGVYEDGEIIDSLTLSELIKDTLKNNKISAKKSTPPMTHNLFLTKASIFSASLKSSWREFLVDVKMTF